MSKALGRGGAGGKWTSSRVTQSQNQTAAPPASSPTVATPMSAPHSAGGHGFEDSAVNEHARRQHAAADETPAAANFDRQTAADALSNLWFFRANADSDDFDLYKVEKQIIQPSSSVDFNRDILSKIKPPK
eukprot:CAMPEP_0176432490 /NCGR_PEP_ID=MMETSP0127-20121128/15426_1 /TAXON_ID=938130 /ORGANISM="Platyophrya macrostoma, Strain WH" /LENGTH=130 /DNA_ID=CAMNT_0017814673 /DNA_START=43 /DNA_END=435 /DNA_ORIENTATION=+